MSNFPAAVPILPALPSYSQADILALFDRILPEHYLTPIKNPGPGYEYLQAVAKMTERVSSAVANTCTSAYIGSATGGSYATVLVELSRPNASYGACTLLGRDAAPRGTLVGTQDGYYYELLTQAAFGAGDVGPVQVQARATVRGWLWNRPGPFTTGDGELIAGPINRLVYPVFPLTPSPPNFDPTITVRQVTAATGGSAGMLDGLGEDRGISRSFSGITRAQVSRAGTDAISILPGTVFSTADGFHYKVTAQLNFAAGEVDPKWVSVEPLFINVQANVQPLSLVISVLWGTAVTDTLTVTSYTPVRESDGDYRTRISLLPDTVTPNAMRATIRKVLGPSLTFFYREPWDLRYQTAYDFPANGTFTYANVNVAVPPFNGNIFVYDHAPSDPLSNRYLADNTPGSVMVVALPNLGTPEVFATLYPAVADNLEQVKPAGATVLYVIAP